MSGKPSRRDFLKTSVAALGAGAVMPNPLEAAMKLGGESKPVCIASYNGFLPKTNSGAVVTAMDILKKGGNTLDAVIAGVNTVEDDPNDMTVGLGGLPNEEGVVELDSSVMDGPTYNAGAVASLRNIRNPSKVARMVMERTDHVLIVGEGALRFARALGFEEQNLLTERAREIWLRWKENLSPNDNWFPPNEEMSEDVRAAIDFRTRPTGTINCLAVNEKGDISGVTTTSGLAWKIPGRVGDSPIIGAGLYVDNNVGAAGSTGRGEEAIKSCGAFHTVMQMALGKSPEEACLATMKRIANSYKMNMKWLSSFDIKFYAVNKKGEHGSAALWESKEHGYYAMADDIGARHAKRAFLFPLSKRVR